MYLTLRIEDMRGLRCFMIVGLLSLLSFTAHAQCKFRNTAFSSGELLTYNLYYNWQFIWVKAGNASLSTIQTVYKGTPAYRASLVTRGSEKVDGMFILRDTLLCYSSTQLEPLYYRKGAKEGDRYTVDEVFYSYAGGKCDIKQHRQKSSGKHEWRQSSLDHCVYDMLNIFLRARSFSVSGWEKGHVVDFPIADGNGVTPARLVYQGKKNIKADNNVKYRCLQLCYMEMEKGKYKRIVDFYVTDDENHVPVRLDMFLRFGSAKAFLINSKGLRNPVNSVVK